MRMIELTKELVYAAALDAAHRNMRRNGRTALNDDDVLAYHAEFNRLVPDTQEGIELWMRLPE